MEAYTRTNNILVPDIVHTEANGGPSCVNVYVFGPQEEEEEKDGPHTLSTPAGGEDDDLVPKGLSYEMLEASNTKELETKTDAEITSSAL